MKETDKKKCPKCQSVDVSDTGNRRGDTTTIELMEKYQNPNIRFINVGIVKKSLSIYLTIRKLLLTGY